VIRQFCVTSQETPPFDRIGNSAKSVPFPFRFRSQFAFDSQSS
jgi:hypothetical protein